MCVKACVCVLDVRELWVLNGRWGRWWETSKTMRNDDGGQKGMGKKTGAWGRQGHGEKGGDKGVTKDCPMRGDGKGMKVSGGSDAVAACIRNCIANGTIICRIQRLRPWWEDLCLCG